MPVFELGQVSHLNQLGLEFLEETSGEFVAALAGVGRMFYQPYVVDLDPLRIGVTATEERRAIAVLANRVLRGEFNRIIYLRNAPAVPWEGDPVGYARLIFDAQKIRVVATVHVVALEGEDAIIQSSLLPG